MLRIITFLLLSFTISSCSFMKQSINNNAATLKTTTCWKITGWQTPIPVGGNPTLGNYPTLVSMQCNAKSNYNYWVEAGDTGSIFLMVGRNDPYIDTYTAQEADGNGPAGKYFWRMLVIENGIASPPVIRTDTIPSLSIPPLTPVTSSCPVGPCMWID